MYSAYADSECVLASLSNIDLAALCSERKEINTHVRPFVKQARYEIFEDQITNVFANSGDADAATGGSELEDPEQFRLCLQTLGLLEHMPEDKIVAAWDRLSEERPDGRRAVTRTALVRWWVRVDWKMQVAEEDQVAQKVVQLEAASRKLWESTQTMEASVHDIEKLLARSM